MIKQLEQIGLDHALDKLAARNDDVEARVAGAKLGEQLVVGGKATVLTSDAACLLEVGKRGLADIGVPVWRIARLLSAEAEALCRGG